MQKNAHKTRAGLLLMAVLALGAAALYMLVNVDFENEKLFAYAMRIRAPKLFAMMITAFAIGGASLVFQSVINNTIVTLYADSYGSYLCSRIRQYTGC